MAYFPNVLTSQQIVYLSRSGVVADGVTDQTTKIQAVLDSTAGMPLVVVNDVIGGLVLADGLKLWSNTTLETLAGCGWKKRGYGGTVARAGGGVPLFTNKNPTGGPTTWPDSNIRVRGGYWDGNRRGFSAGGTTAYWTTKGDATIAKFADNRDYVIPMSGFYGVQHCVAEDMVIFDGTSYGVQASNVDDFRAQNLTKVLNPGDTVSGDNCVQLEGYCTNVRIYGIRGEGNDDLVAINANDGQDIYPGGSPVTFPAYIISGDCSDIVVRDITLNASPNYGNCLRLLVGSASITRLLVDGVRNKAAAANLGVYFSNFTIPGPGAFDDVIIRDIGGLLPYNGFVNLQNTDCNIRRLIIDGIQAQGQNSRSVVQMVGGTVAQMVLTNVTATACPYLFEITGGAVTDMARGPYSAAGLTADIHDAGSRITTIRRS